MEVSIWQEYRDQGLQVVGISNEPLAVIESFIEDQGISFPILHDVNGVYSAYNLPGGDSPYPRDFVIDGAGILRYTSTEYEPGAIISVVEDLLNPTSGMIPDQGPSAPAHPVLLSIRPNPANPRIQIQLQVSQTSRLQGRILDVRGHEVTRLFTQEEFPAGQHLISWAGGNSPAGIYFVQIESVEGKAVTRRFVLLR